ncbi:MAG: hypothetical protein ACI4E1_10795 [Lachnospira sp.]
MKMSYKTKKIKSMVTLMLLLVVLGVSSLTVAQASNDREYFTLSTEAYYGDDYAVSKFQAKDTTASVNTTVSYAGGVLDYSVVGSMNQVNDAYYDCSNGYVYRISSTGQYEMYSWVKEWGYRYAALRVDAVNDSYTYHEGYFIGN